MELETIRHEVEDQVLVLQLNRPQRMNAVTEQLYDDLLQALEQARADKDIRAVVLTGSELQRGGQSKQAFCAGADLKEHAAGRRSGWQKRQYLQLANRACLALARLPKPVVAAVNGPARGAGVELALNCDFILMAEDATLALTETSLGSFVGGGATKILERLVGLAQARRLVYTGCIVDGSEAVRLGLALGCWPLAELMPRALELARTLAGQAPISLAFAKDLLNRAAERDLETAMLAEAEAILACMQTSDWQEGIDSFRERRRPRFEGE